MLHPQPLPAEMGALLITHIQVGLFRGLGGGPVANPRCLEIEGLKEACQFPIVELAARRQPGFFSWSDKGYD